MNQNGYFAAPCGRLFLATSAFGLLAAGFMSMAGPPLPAPALPVVILACIIGSLVSIGLAIEAFPAAALLQILTLPIVGGFYFAALVVATQAPHPAGILPLLGGAALAWTAMRGGRRQSRKATALRGAPQAR